MKTLLEEAGFKCNLKIYSDSSSGRAMCYRIGAGSQKHIEARRFFVQQLFRDRKLRLEKVCGEVNPADLGTKMLPAKTLRVLMPLAGMYVGDEVCAIVGGLGLGLGLAATSGHNSKVINLMMMLSQLLCVKGDSNDEQDLWPTSWMINVIMMFALVGVISVFTEVRSRWLRPTRRSRGVQTDAEPASPAAAGLRNLRMNEDLKIFMTTKQDFLSGEPRKKFHVKRECRGLSNALCVGAYDACKLCAGLSDDPDSVTLVWAEGACEYNCSLVRVFHI